MREQKNRKKKPLWLRILLTLLIILMVGALAAVAAVAYFTRNLTMDHTSHDDQDLGIGTVVEWNESMTELPEISSEEPEVSASEVSSEDLAEFPKKPYIKHRAPKEIKRRDGNQEESEMEAEPEEESEEETPNLDDVSLVPIQTVSREGVINIALFGMSSESIFDTLRSDSMIILTLDTNHSMIKLTSVLRDSKVPIEGYRAQKINAAYRLGGPWLAIKTLNQNFGLDIRNYVSVDLGQMEAVINAMGGIYMNVTAEEARALGCASGDIWMDGSLAVSYCRLRSVGTDTARARRQRNVLNYIFYRFKDMSVSDKLDFAQLFLNYVTTSLSWGEIVEMLSLPLAYYGMATNSVPIEGVDRNVWGGIDSYGEWVWVFDIPSAARRVQNFIYG